MKWYVVHTYSGYEAKARAGLLERVKTHGLEGKFGEVLIPTENVVEMVKGQRRTSTRKFFFSMRSSRSATRRSSGRAARGSARSSRAGRRS